MQAARCANGNVIIKPNLGADGEGIIIKHVSDLTEDDFMHHTVQLLITDLMLFNKCKFHIRVMYLWVPGERAYLMWNGLVLASPNKFQKDDSRLAVQLTNRSFHQGDSQVSWSPSFKSWSHHAACLPALEDMGRELFDKLESGVLKKAMLNASCTLYDLYGLDVLFTSSGLCKLLEVNVYWSMYRDLTLVSMVQDAFALLTGNAAASTGEFFAYTSPDDHQSKRQRHG